MWFVYSSQYWTCACHDARRCTYVQDARESNSFHTCDSFNTYKYHNGFSVAFVRVIVNYIHSCGNSNYYMFKSCMYRGQWHVWGSMVCTRVNGMYAGQWYVQGSTVCTGVSGMYGGQWYVRGSTVCADERFLYRSTCSYREIRIIGTHTK